MDDEKILEDAWAIDMKVEYGCGEQVTVLGAKDVTMHDSRGNEIEVPRCESCGNYMCQVIGSTHYAWICFCGYQCEPEEI